MVRNLVGTLLAGGQRVPEAGRYPGHSRCQESKRCRGDRARLRTVPGQRGVRNVMSTDDRKSRPRNTIVSTNPATGEKLAELGVRHCRRKFTTRCRRARQAQPAWQALAGGRTHCGAEALPANAERAARRGGDVDLARGRQADGRSAEHRSPGRAGCGRILHSHGAQLPARRTATARQPRHEDQARQAGARALRRDRHHRAVELSVLDSGDRDAGGVW